MLITYDSTRAVTVMKKNDYEVYIKMYNLETYEETFEEMIGGREDQYIKVKEVEQNSTGTMFAVVYFDDGYFRMRTFGKEQRDRSVIAEEEVDFNRIFGLDNYTMANADFADPFITCCFATDNYIFVNFFYNYTRTHYHFLWDIVKRKVVGIPQKSKKIQGDISDLPIK